MPVSSYGGSTDSLASPSLSSWAASVSAALDGSDTTVNTRLATKADLASPTFTGTVTLPADVRGWATNLLTPTQASFETGTVTGWSNNTNATLTASTAQARVGTYSMSMSSNAAGIMKATTPAVAVVGGQTHTYMAHVRSATVARSVDLYVQWYAGATYLSQTTLASATSTTTSWTPIRLTVTAPATATAGVIYIAVNSTAAASEVHYFDCFGLWEGAGGEWEPPGRPINALGTYTDETVGRRIFTWDTVNARWQMTYGDTGWREMNGSMLNGWTAGNFLLRRTNSQCLVYFGGLNGSASTSTSILTVPSGWARPAAYTAYMAYAGDSSVVRLMGLGASVLVAGSQADTSANGSLTWGTAAAWPTSLPGTASGSIPT